MKANLILTIAIGALLTSCNGNVKRDATGTFEATEVTVSNEIPGKLVYFNVTEGDNLNAGQTVGMIDSVQLQLQKLQLRRSGVSILSNKPEISAQVASLEAQIAKQRSEKVRFENLLKAKAATQKQVDDINSAITVLQGQLAALKSTLSNNTSSLNAQSSAVDVQIAQIDDKLAKCHITSPVSGTVLAKYVEQGEMAVTGQPLFKVADLNNIFLRVYLTAAQLHDVKIGQTVKVTPSGSGKTYDGKVTWISPNSDFTPKNIQSADERENLVYAMKIAVKNDGLIKIGMYGDVTFK